MATARPFAYNTGAPIAGTEQVGSLAVGYPTSGFVGLPWWNGPNEELGYVIARPVPDNTQETPVFSSSPLTLSPTYKGTNINLSNSNQTAYQQFGYEQSVLGQTFLNNNDKVMFSVSLSLANPPALPDSHFVGFGTTSMNYQGNPYGAFPGNDNQSIGLGSAGDYYFNGAVQATGLPTFGDGDIIDVAVDLGNNKIWIRVNGGNWNGSPTQNPATGNGSLGIGGLTSFYPVLCPGYEGTMTVQNSATYGVPSGFKLLGTNVNASVGFFRSSALTEGSFIGLANYIAGPSGGGPFASGSSAKTWLNANGYWTSFSGGATGATSGNYNLINLYSPANTNGSITFPGSDNAASNNPNTVGLNPGNGIYINKFDLAGNDQSSVLDSLLGRSGTLILTQGVNSVTYSFTSTAFNYSSSGPYTNQYWWDNYHNGAQSPLGTLTVTSSSPSNFNYTDAITITVS